VIYYYNFSHASCHRNITPRGKEYGLKDILIVRLDSSELFSNRGIPYEAFEESWTDAVYRPQQQKRASSKTKLSQTTDHNDSRSKAAPAAFPKKPRDCCPIQLQSQHTLKHY